ncbi:MAG: type II toxin-antitoxin system ParD family antitoxin [Alphaproteobacteria bacterium]|nr:type II toxin-antitoxin system ParD family antitoxin [Alphaproteobacteria bacterium]
MNVSLTPTLEKFVRRKVASGLYNNASEVVRDGLRLLAEREAAAARPAAPPQKHEVRAALARREKELRAKGVRSLALFGSVLRGDAGAGSDVDVLIGVDPKARLSLVGLVSIKNLLEERLGRPVDVVTRDGIDPAIRDAVFREAERVF